MATAGTDLVTAEGLKGSLGKMKAEPGARVELYSNPNATTSNSSVTLSQSVDGFRYFEVTTLGSVYSTSVIPKKTCAVMGWSANRSAPSDDIRVQMSGTTMSVTLNYGTSNTGLGIVRVVGIV